MEGLLRKDESSAQANPDFQGILETTLKRWSNNWRGSGGRAAAAATHRRPGGLLRSGSCGGQESPGPGHRPAEEGIWPAAVSGPGSDSAVIRSELLIGSGGESRHRLRTEEFRGPMDLTGSGRWDFVDWQVQWGMFLAAAVHPGRGSITRSQAAAGRDQLPVNH